jgi:hypothetical protein
MPESFSNWNKKTCSVINGSPVEEIYTCQDAYEIYRDKVGRSGAAWLVLQENLRLASRQEKSEGGNKSTIYITDGYMHLAINATKADKPKRHLAFWSSGAA